MNFSNGHASPALSLSGADDVAGQRSEHAHVFWSLAGALFDVGLVRRIGPLTGATALAVRRFGAEGWFQSNKKFGDHLCLLSPKCESRSYSLLSSAAF